MSMFEEFLGQTVLMFQSTDEIWRDSIVTIKDVKVVDRREFFGKMLPVKRPVVEYADGTEVLLHPSMGLRIYSEEELKEDLLVRANERYQFIEFEKVKITYAQHDTYEFLYVIQNVETNEIIKLQPEYSMNQLCQSFMDFFNMDGRE
ncbi:hypothetical protein PQE74_gp028 [Bacillus phage vB_BanS_Chewbecca]|uniref:Uncharacterized protein n=1 Tax=Bacillus phage vB_BanS_Chewbecca TaxID=2894786 RepID=A0AAE9CA39_9CAUD|nr:hypothetical protein PQE74_gp028 [Bacillus phage vB_BanS_Chewbecca]UGO46111.1 hypothetical protein CHEWBECCA_28 [Bacillus phage vB_BanS_Chewbecca]